MSRLTGFGLFLAIVAAAMLLPGCSDDSTQPCCKVCVTSPNGGEHWTAGEDYAISWCMQGPCGTSVRIELLRAGEVCATVADSTANDGEYTWVAQACGNDSTAYQMRITALDTERSDTSDEEFMISPLPEEECILTLISPVGGERFEVDEEVTIEWDGSAACCDSIDVELLHEGEACETLLAAAPRTGTHLWVADVCAEDSSSYAIRVSDRCTGAATATSTTFRIVYPEVPPSCTITLLTPNDGQPFAAGDNVEITWSYEGDCGTTAQVDLLRGEDVCSTLGTDLPIDGSLNWIAERCSDPPEKELATAEHDDYRIRVTASGTGASDASDNAFMIMEPVEPCAITVTAPNGDEQWIEGEPATITWTSTGACADSVEIVLLQAQAQCAVIAARVPNSGSYEWPAAAQCSDEVAGYMVRVSDPEGEASDESDAEFVIIDATVIPECDLTYTGPAGGETYCPGDPVAITWTQSGECGGDLRIELLHDGEPCATIAAETENDGSYEWPAAACDGLTAGYTIRLTELENETVAAGTTTFSIYPACSLELTSPTGGEVYCAESTIEVQWEASVCCGETVTVELLHDGEPCALLADGTENDGLLAWTAAQCAGATDGYTVRLTDPGTGMTVASAAPFQIYPACGVNVTAPAGGGSYCTGDALEILWEASTCCGATVRIDLYRDGELYTTLAETTENDGAFTWDAALSGTETEGFTVRVTDLANDVYDETTAAFAIYPACNVALTALAAEEYCTGDAIEIAWSSSTCCGSEVALDLLHDGEVVRPIAATTENDGTLIWAAEQSDDHVEDYSIRVTDLASGATAELAAPFKIHPPCGLTVTTPNGDEPFCQNQEIDIAWDRSTCCDGPTVRIELLFQGTVCDVIAEETANDGLHPWIAQRCEEEADGYTIRVTELASGATDVSDDPFQIQPSCALALTAPGGDGVYCAGETISIAWNSGACCGDQVAIELLRNGVPRMTIAEETENDGSYDWPAAPFGEFAEGYTVRVTDLASGASDTSPAAMTIHPACLIDVLYPTHGDLACIDDEVTIQWAPNSPCCGETVKIQLYHYDDLATTIASSTENDGEHVWPAATQYNDFPNGYHVVITDLESGTASRGEGEFSIWEGDVTVTMSTEPTPYCSGELIPITWTPSPCKGTTAKIELLLDGEICKTIVSSTANDGLYEWPAEQCDGETEGYTVRVTDTSTGNYDDSNVAFPILPPCTVAVASPAGGETYCPGDEVAISWAAGGECCGETVAIELLRDGSLVTLLAEETENDGVFSWPAEQFDGIAAGYSVRVVDLTSSGESESGTFALEGECALGLTGPTGTFCPGEETEITWTTAFCCGEAVRLELLVDGMPCLTLANETDNDGVFEWTVEACDGPGEYGIRITDLGTGFEIADPTMFMIEAPCEIDVTAPDAGEIYCEGDDVPIAWAPSTCCGATVAIELLREGAPVLTIAAETENDGSFTWPAEQQGGESEGYTIRISDLESGFSDENPGPFTIGPPCDLNVAYPDGGEVLCEGEDAELTWAVSPCCGETVRLELLNMDEPCKTIIEETENDGSFVWQVEACPFGFTNPDRYRLRVIDLETDVVGESEREFAIYDGCELDLFRPNEGRPICHGTNYTIRWAPSACCGAEVMIELLREGRPVDTLAVATENDGNFLWEIDPCSDDDPLGQGDPCPPPDGYAIRITDLETGTTDVSDNMFQMLPSCVLDFTAPRNDQVFCVGDPISIEWVGSECCATRLQIELMQGGTPCLEITDETLNDGEFVWTAEQCGGGPDNYSLRITELSTGFAHDMAWTFSIEVCPPGPEGE